MLAWLQALITFRKQGGGFQVPELDAMGRIPINALLTSPIEVSATAPTTVDGSVLWVNTTAGFEGVYFYDTTRGKWLEVSFVKHVFGDDSADNEVLRTAVVNGAGVNTGYPLAQDMTIVGVQAHSRAGLATKGFEIRRNGVNVHAFNLVANDYSDMTLNIDVAGAANGFLDAFAVAAGGNSLDVTVDVYLRRRGA